MNTWRIAEEFRLIAAADPAFTGIACVNEQSSDEATFPRLVFGARGRFLPGSAQVAIAEVTISVESHAQDAAADAAATQSHDHLLELTRKKFFGADDATAPAARAALAAAISTAGRLDVDPRILPVGSDPGIDGHRFKTPLSLKCGVCFPAV